MLIVNSEDGWKENVSGDQQALTFQQEYGEDSKELEFIY
jgi:hypothetical protein